MDERERWREGWMRGRGGGRVDERERMRGRGGGRVDERER